MRLTRGVVITSLHVHNREGYCWGDYKDKLFDAICGVVPMPPGVDWRVEAAFLNAMPPEFDELLLNLSALRPQPDEDPDENYRARQAREAHWTLNRSDLDAPNQRGSAYVAIVAGMKNHGFELLDNQSCHTIMLPSAGFFDGMDTPEALESILHKNYVSRQELARMKQKSKNRGLRWRNAADQKC